MNTSQLLRTLGLLLQAPSMYQQAKSESDTARVQKMLEDAKLYRYKNPTTFNISTPRFDFTTAGIKRKPLPETTLADLRPDVFGEIQKNPQALLQFMTTPNASQTFNAAQTLGFLPKDKTVGGADEKIYVDYNGLKLPLTGYQALQYMQGVESKYDLTTSEIAQIRGSLKDRYYDAFMGWPEDFDYDKEFEKLAREIFPKRFGGTSKKAGRWDDMIGE